MSATSITSTPPPPALYKIDDSWDGFMWLNVDDAARSSVAIMRLAPRSRSYLVCALNFTPVQYDGFIIGLPRRGTLTELISSDDIKYGGSGVHNAAEIRSADEALRRAEIQRRHHPAGHERRLVQVHPRAAEKARRQGQGRALKNARAPNDTRGRASSVKE